MAEAVDPIILLTAATHFCTGKHPSICIHPRDDVAVKVYSRGYSLYYMVGRVDRDNMILDWGRNIDGVYYDKGSNPSVTLIHHNDQLIAVEVHTSAFFKTCYYHVGIVNANGNTIDWGNSHRLCRGLKPKVCAKDDLTVIVIKEEANAINRIQSHIGQVAVDDRDVNWHGGQRRCRLIQNISGVEPAIAMNEQGTITVVYRSGRSSLNIIIGRLAQNGTINWGIPQPYGEGINPSVSINGQGNLVEFHQSRMFRKLYHSVGMINEQMLQIQWNNMINQPYTLGRYPNISLCDDGYMLEVHQTNAYSLNNSLYFTQGILKGRRVNGQRPANPPHHDPPNHDPGDEPHGEHQPLDPPGHAPNVEELNIENAPGDVQDNFDEDNRDHIRDDPL